ncbi:MAG: prepilin-type N-terminal cleavage/methylation domain-containing protein [Myxococcaceae bacterium]|nr:prepilin-type N-terminal cleavage/methylation domain-containing protein [Myxococcaceae bacterium]MCI0673188.1 prepilin-type N-terminal cleavage/methylation domain-containing protein [Myxococcaceae bacterium]
MRAQRSPGFTLLELAVALAIAAILTALSVAALDGLRTRASFSNVSARIAQGVRQTRAEAFGRGVATAFIVDTVDGRWWGVEAPDGFDVDAFDPAAPGTVIVSGSFPEGITFGPTDGYGASLAAPFAGVPVTSACSFCRDAGTNQGFGAVVFEPRGGARFLGAPRAMGHQFTLTGTHRGATRTLAVAILGLSGVVETFER